MVGDEDRTMTKKGGGGEGRVRSRSTRAETMRERRGSIESLVERQLPHLLDPTLPFLASPLQLPVRPLFRSTGFSASFPFLELVYPATTFVE